MESTPPALPSTTLPLLLRPAAAIAQRVRETPPRYLLGTLAAMGTYLLAMRLATGETRTEQPIACAAILALVVWSPGTRRFFPGMLPFVLFGVTHDLTHITQPLCRYLHIHGREPYWFDHTFFGIRTDGVVLTPNEFFARHHWPAVDFVTGLAYIVF